MAGLIKQLIDGVVDAAVKEVLKKVGIGRTTTRAGGTKASGGVIGDIIDAALGQEKKPARKAAKKPAAKSAAAKRSAAKDTAAKSTAAKKPAKRTTTAAAKKKTRET